MYINKANNSSKTQRFGTCTFAAMFVVESLTENAEVARQRSSVQWIHKLRVVLPRTTSRISPSYYQKEKTRDTSNNECNCSRSVVDGCT